MRVSFAELPQWLLGPEAAAESQTTHLLPRWIFLRALGVIWFSAFYSFLFQVKGLIGTQGLLPASEALDSLRHSSLGWQKYWVVPSLLWFSSGDHALMALCWVGLAASIALLFNLWPRLSLFVCVICFLSIAAVARDFSGYQSDGMLLEAGFISMFFAPRGLRPGLGVSSFPSRLSRFLLLWEWFRIYFESGVVKLASGDYSWRHLTAMDDYYQNGPLPTWIGWYVQHLPHWFHAATALMTLVTELGLVFMMFLPRKLRLICFLIVTPFQIGIILTANYTFLNYLVLTLGFLLLDDGFIRPRLPQRWRSPAPSIEPAVPRKESPLAVPLRVAAGVCLLWVFYATTALLFTLLPGFPKLPDSPVRALEPFRIANQYGLFAVMTHQRFEIEFQGSNDGKEWTTYPFRYKPQDVHKAPGIYAPYQPRFDWNLWFASLDNWRNDLWVLQAEVKLLDNDHDVLELFAGNPFSNGPPRMVRTVVWQYWFTDMQTKHAEGRWWRREFMGKYAPQVERAPDGKVVLSTPAEADEPSH